jgi:hypothetical protein
MATDRKRNAALAPSIPKDQDESRAIRIARRNWCAWQADFEGGGALLPSDPSRFNAFCAEYGVGRTIRAGTRDELRKRLSRRLRSALRDGTGHALDLLEQQLRPRFGTRLGRGRMTSVLSKMAAFVRPERFIAWDSYARRGLNLTLGRAAAHPYRTYAEYLAALDLVWQGQFGRQVRRCIRHGAQSPIDRKPQFQRRAFDVCLMRIGGRWDGQR